MNRPPTSSSDSMRSDDPVVVYRTRVLYEADMVAEAMTRAGVPFFRRMESIGGLSFAMPVPPPMGAPGALWAIAVPGSWVDRAAHFIAKLPVSQEIEPGKRGFRPPGVKEFFRGWAWLFVVAIVLVLVWTIFRMYME